MDSEEKPGVFYRIVRMAQGAVDAAKVALQPFLPLCIRLHQIDAAKTLNLSLHRELLDIEKKLIEEGHSQPAPHPGRTDPMKTPEAMKALESVKAAAKHRAFKDPRTGLWPWELN